MGRLEAPFQDRPQHLVNEVFRDENPCIYKGSFKQENDWSYDWDPSFRAFKNPIKFMLIFQKRSLII